MVMKSDGTKLTQKHPIRVSSNMATNLFHSEVNLFPIYDSTDSNNCSCASINDMSNLLYKKKNITAEQ